MHFRILVELSQRWLKFNSSDMDRANVKLNCDIAMASAHPLYKYLGFKVHIPTDSMGNRLKNLDQCSSDLEN